MAPRDGEWRRYPRTLEGAWHAIDDLRDAVGGPDGVDRIRDALESMADAELMAKHLSEALAAQRKSLLTGVKGVILTTAGAVTAGAAIATAIHTWIH